MTDAELLNIARQALPSRLKAAQLRIVKRGNAPTHLAQSPMTEQDTRLKNELEAILKFKLPKVPTKQPGTVDVAVTEASDMGTRTTVVQIRNGVVRRVIVQA